MFTKLQGKRKHHRHHQPKCKLSKNLFGKQQEHDKKIVAQEAIVHVHLKLYENFFVFKLNMRLNLLLYDH